MKLAAASALNDDTVARNNTAEKGAGRNDATRSDASRDGGHSAESTNYRQSSHASAARSTVMPGRSLDVGEPHNVDNSLGTRSIGGTSVSLAEEGLNTRFLGVKTERDRTKEEIKQWLKDFEEREGKPPTNKLASETLGDRSSSAHKKLWTSSGFKSTPFPCPSSVCAEHADNFLRVFNRAYITL